MEQQVAWEIVVAAIVGGFIGGGAITGLSYRALKDKLIGDLREVFARKSELDNLGSRVNGLETVVVMARDAADTNSDRILRLEEASKHQWPQAMALLEKIDARLGKTEQSVTRLTTLMERD